VVRPCAGPTQLILVYTLFGTAADAQKAAQTIVSERLAACANIMPACLSIYEWGGAMQQAAETPVIFKTNADRRDALMARIAALHSYDTPAIVAIEGTASAAFEGWIMQQVS